MTHEFNRVEKEEFPKQLKFGKYQYLQRIIF